MNVIIKNNAPRIFIFKGRDVSNTIQKILIRPLENDNAYQEVDPKYWDLVKNQPLVKALIKSGDIVIMNADDLEDSDEIVPAEVQAKRVAGDALVKGKDVMKQEITDALKSGDIDKIKETHPEIAEMIEAMVSAAVEASKDADDNEDPASEDGDLAENVDALTEKLGNDIAEDDLKAALREFATKKYDLTLHHNAGVPKMIEAIKEKEAELGNVD